MAQLEEGDVVLCTVDRIVGTVVFVKIKDDGEGSIITSEIAAGRIRNLRDYVVPKKKIVCKVLKIDNSGNIHLSLRRVSQKEKKQVLEENKQEKSFQSILKSIIGDKAKEITKEIRKQSPLIDFIDEIKKDAKKLEKFIGKEAEKVLKILKLEKKKKSVVKKEFHLKTTKPNGLSLIKDILSKQKDVEIKYISAGKYSIKAELADLKSSDNKIQEVFKDIEKQAKKQGLEFSEKNK